MDGSTWQNYEWGTAPSVHTRCTEGARNGFLRRDQASAFSLVSRTHLIVKDIFALILLILGGIETNPGPTPCFICLPSNWNQYGV